MKKFKIQNSKLEIGIAVIIYLTSALPARAAFGLGDSFGFGDIKSLGQAADRLVIPAFSVATTLVIIYFLYGAFKLLTSAGDDNQVKAARDMITHAIIGFVLLMAAFIVLQFLVSSLFGINYKVIKGF